MATQLNRRQPEAWARVLNILERNELHFAVGKCEPCARHDLACFGE